MTALEAMMPVIVVTDGKAAELTHPSTANQARTFPPPAEVPRA